MKQLIGICAVALLAVLAAACGCTSTGNESEGTGTRQIWKGDEQHEPRQADLASAAVTLGITEEEFRAALDGQGQDFPAAAAELGVSEEALIEALGVSKGGKMIVGP